MKGLSKMMRWLNLLLILVTFLAYLSPFINPQSFSWINIIGTAYPFLLLLNVLFVLFWSFLKNRYFLFSLCCIIMGWNHLTSFIGLSFSSGDQTDTCINILTFNTSGLTFLKDKNKNKEQENVNSFSSFLQKEGTIDILCLQEINSYTAQVLAKKFNFKYEHKIPYKGTSVLSQHPILQSGQIEFTTNANSCLWADIKINKKTIRVYSLHLKSNNVSGETERILSERELQERKTWSDIKGVFGKFRYTSKIRIQQAKKVQAHIEKSPHPVVLCGDFNETPQSYVYRMFSKNLKDTFQEKGFGFGTTYAGRLPALRIDYILTDPRLTVLDCQVLKEKHSDHYPVFSTLSLD